MRCGPHVLDELVDLLAELALLLIGGTGPGIEGHLGDDVLFAETAGIDAGNGEGVTRLELDQDDVDQLDRFIEFLGVSARGVHQQIDAAVLGTCFLAATREQGGQQGRDGE